MLYLIIYIKSLHVVKRWLPRLIYQNKIDPLSSIFYPLSSTQSLQAILNGEEEVEAWLNAGEVPLKKALEDLIRPVSTVTHHPVSTAVNNNKNKSEECTKPFDLE
jgi:hypothetical protein